MKCLMCGKNQAQNIPPYGNLPCKACILRSKKFDVGTTIEITTENIKEDRKKYSKDIEQRYEGNTPNLNYINQYGTKGFSPDELKRARAAHTTYYRDSHLKYNPKAAPKALRKMV